MIVKYLMIFYFVFDSETLRVARSILNFSVFFSKVRALVSKIIREGEEVQKCH